MGVFPDVGTQSSSEVGVVVLVSGKHFLKGWAENVHPHVPGFMSVWMAKGSFVQSG